MGFTFPGDTESMFYLLRKLDKSGCSAGIQKNLTGLLLYDHFLVGSVDWGGSLAQRLTVPVWFLPFSSSYNMLICEPLLCISFTDIQVCLVYAHF